MCTDESLARYTKQGQIKNRILVKQDLDFYCLYYLNIFTRMYSCIATVIFQKGKSVGTERYYKGTTK